MEEPTWPADENERLYEGLRQKASWAYKEVYRRFYHPFLKFVLQNSGTQEDARDAFQDFIVVLYEKEDFKVDEPKKLPGYLTQALRYQWFMWLRKRKKRPPTRDLDGLPELSDDSSGLYDKEVLEDKAIAAEEAFGQLGEDCQRLLMLFYFEKKPLREIAALMDYTEAYARQKRFRCVGKLKDLLGE
jgi:RNA polymerase sigma factor (sigma-70 family)